MMTFELSGQTLQNPNAAMKFRALVFKIFGLKPCVVRSDGIRQIGDAQKRKIKWTLFHESKLTYVKVNPVSQVVAYRWPCGDTLFLRR
jgi:hypothetical protein